MASKAGGRTRTAIIGIAIVLVLQLILMLLGRFYSIGFDPQKGARSTPHTVFIITKYDREPVLGGLFAFDTDQRHLPWFRDIEMVKRVSAVEGDKVAVIDGVLLINGQPAAHRNPRILDKLALAMPDYDLAFDTEMTVPADHYVMLTDSIDGFDSRYWGLVKKSAIRGRAVPVF